MTVPPQVLAAVRDAREVVVASHIPMDGDGLGCALALKRALEAAGRRCTVVTEAAPPAGYDFLPGFDGIVRLGREDPFPACDLLVGVDAGSTDRLGRAWTERPAGSRVLNLDHHVSNEGYGDVSWVDPDAAATGELVHALLAESGLPFDGGAALCLLVALVTDTGRFGHSNTTARTLEIAADLVRRGASPDLVSRRLYRSIPRALVELHARAVHAAEFLDEGRLAILVAPHGFGDDLGLGEDAVRDLVELLGSLSGVCVAALFRGRAEGGTKVSLRSADDAADVARLAARHGGGGHVRAAGFSTDAAPGEAADALRQELRALVAAAR